jgi:hypothetical protein
MVVMAMAVVVVVVVVSSIVAQWLQMLVLLLFLVLSLVLPLAAPQSLLLLPLLPCPWTRTLLRTGSMPTTPLHSTPLSAGTEGRRREGTLPSTDDGTVVKVAKGW